MRKNERGECKRESTYPVPSNPCIKNSSKKAFAPASMSSDITKDYRYVC